MPEVAKEMQTAWEIAVRVSGGEVNTASLLWARGDDADVFLMSKTPPLKELAQSPVFHRWLARQILGTLDLPEKDWPKAKKTAQWRERAHYLYRATQTLKQYGWGKNLKTGFRVPVHDEGLNRNYSQ